jgi:hypothetical protein
MPPLEISPSHLDIPRGFASGTPIDSPLRQSVVDVVGLQEGEGVEADRGPRTSVSDSPIYTVYSDGNGPFRR